MRNDKILKKFGSGIRISENQKEFLDTHGIGVQRVFNIGMHTLMLSVQCPLAPTCIYLTITDNRVVRSALPCESPAAGTAQKRPVGWSLCPIRAAFIGQKENHINWPVISPGKNEII